VALELQKGQMMEARHAESWGQVCWGLDGEHNSLIAFLLLFTLLLFSIFKFKTFVVKSFFFSVL
jgi:hypothetical protein